MFAVISLKRFLKWVLLIFLVTCSITAVLFKYSHSIVPATVDHEMTQEIQNIFDTRNEAALKNELITLQSLYITDRKYGLWAYEHEVKRIKYLNRWAAKQDIKFTSIDSDIVTRYVKDKGNLVTINIIKSTDYKYIYNNEPDKLNSFRIGTYHLLDLTLTDNGWKIVKEWYTDPFADSMQLDDMHTDGIKAYISSASPRDFSSLNKRRLDAVDYADRYCGAAAPKEYSYKYNSKYRDYNPLGGDCANFASQILFEGGKFRKTKVWNYDGGGTKAWVNAQAFKNFMIGSGRASVIAYGTYERVYKASYKLLPGDFIAYEKKGKVTHISVVTGADSKGYALVNCHNTDRYRVPWDLGWSDKGIKFWLVRVHF